MDWKVLATRRSCALLSREEMVQGKVPTTPTTASVIAGVQVQEAVKLLHGLPVLTGQGFVFDGVNHHSYIVRYEQKADCLAHDPYDPIEILPWKTTETTVGQLLEKARSILGPSAVLEMNQDLLSGLICSSCGEEEALYGSLGKVTEAKGLCPRCQEPRTPRLLRIIDGKDAGLLDRVLGTIGVPAWDILGGRVGESQHYFEFQGDREAVLRGLAP